MTHTDALALIKAIDGVTVAILLSTTFICCIQAIRIIFK
jgi:hypothetical protein